MSPRRVLGFAFAALIVAGSTAPDAAESRRGWSKPALVATDDVGRLSLALAPDGQGLLTWGPSATFPEPPFRYAVLRRPGGGFGRPISDARSAALEAVEFDGRGDAVSSYLWFDDSDLTPRQECCVRLAARVRRRGATAFGRSQQLSLPGDSARNPVLATARDGRSAIAWEWGDGIYVSERRPGERFGRVGRVTRGIEAFNEGYPQIGYDRAGTLLVLWSRGTEYVARFRRLGSRFGPTVTVGRPRRGYRLRPPTVAVVAFDVEPRGHAALAWVEVGGRNDRRWRIRVAERRPGQMRFDRPRTVPFGPITESTGRGGGRDTYTFAVRLATALDAEGRAIVAWASCGNDPHMCGVDYSRHGIRAGWTRSRTLNTEFAGGGYVDEPTPLAMNARGHAVLVWAEGSFERDARKTFAVVARPGRAFGRRSLIRSGLLTIAKAEIDKLGNAVIAGSWLNRRHAVMTSQAYVPGMP